jgi:hypothetical protein
MDVGGATMVANMATIALKQPAVAARVVEAGGLPNYGAQMFPVPATMPQLPLIWVEATDENQAEVTKTLEIVVQETAVTLQNLQQQAQVPGDQMVTTFVVQPPSVPAKGMPSRTRSTVTIFVAGAGLALLATVVLDVLLMRRKARRAQRRASAEAGAELQLIDLPTDNHHQTPNGTAPEGVLEAR